MNKNNLILIVAVVALLLSVSALFAAKNSTKTFGGYTAGYWDSAEGYKVDGATIVDGSGNLTISGETQLYNLIIGGATTTLSSSATTSALTAAQASNNAYIEWTPVGETGDATLTLPSDTALRADGFDTDGDWRDFTFRNLADGESNTASTTYIVAGTDIVLLSGSSTVATYTMATNTTMIVRLQRVAASTTLGFITVYGDAD